MEGTYFPIHDVFETFAPDMIFGIQFVEALYASYSYSETITNLICDLTNGTTEFHYIWGFIKLFEPAALREPQVHTRATSSTTSTSAPREGAGMASIRADQLG